MPVMKDFGWRQPLDFPLTHCVLISGESVGHVPAATEDCRGLDLKPGFQHCHSKRSDEVFPFRFAIRHEVSVQIRALINFSLFKI